MSLTGLLGVEVRYVLGDGGQVVTAVGDVDLHRVVRGLPVRRAAAHAGQRHYSGLFWSATTGGHVPYESRLELDRLWLADFDPQVHAIAAQPLWLCGHDGSVVRRHAPDLLLADEGGGFTVVDVKPARLAGRPEVAAVFAWTGRLCAARGWRYEVWTGAPGVLLSNVRWLGQARRPDLVDPGALWLVRQNGRSGMSIGQVVVACSSNVPQAFALPAVLSLLWSGTWRTDLHQPLGSGSVLSCVGEA